MSNTIENLLDRYLQDKATDEEIAELMAALNTGQHDELVQRRISGMLTEASEEDVTPQRREQMLNVITSAERQSPAIVPLDSSRQQSTGYAKWWMAAAVLVLAVTAGLLFLWNVKSPSPVSLAHQQLAPTVHIGKKFVRLPDGSIVLLNGNSELRYGADFGQGTREVFLTGEAYFDILRDSSKPFRVHTGEIVTTVLGTAFNVRALPGTNEVRVTVDRGKVKVGDSDRIYGTITHNQQIVVNTVSYAFRQTDVEAQEVTEWKRSYLILEDMSLADAAILIEEKYHVRIMFENEKLQTCRISATFLNDEDLAQVLTVLTTVTQSTFTQREDGIMIEGEGCGP